MVFSKNIRRALHKLQICWTIKMDRIKAFINGRFQNSDGEVLIKINPVSGAPIAEVDATAEVANSAISFFILFSI